MFCQTCGGRMTGLPVEIGAASLSASETIATRPANAPTPMKALKTAEDAIDAGVGHRRAAEARMASLALGTAAILSLSRATVLPLILSKAPPEKFASFVSPTVQFANWLLAGVFVIACLLAPRKPLHASIGALVLFLAWAIPDILHNPVLIGGGHIGKLVTLSILARAAFAGVMHYLLQYERANEANAIL